MTATIGTWKNPIDNTDEPLSPRLSNILASNDIRNFAAIQMAVQMIDGITLIRNVFASSSSDTSIEIPHQLFHWEMKHFVHRVNEDTIYLDLLQLRDKELLESAKICIDLDEMCQLIRRFFKEYQLGFVMKSAQETVKSCKQFLALPQDLGREFTANANELTDLSEKFGENVALNREALDRADIEVFDCRNNCFDQELILDPIEMRYRQHYSRLNFQDQEDSFNAITNNLEHQLDEIHSAQDKELLCFHTAQDVYQIEIENFKSQINKVPLEYSPALEMIEGEIGYKKAGITAMTRKLKNLKEKLQFYYDQLELYHAQIAAEAARKQAELEEALLQEELAKKAEKARQKEKAKKKKKGKK